MNLSNINFQIPKIKISIRAIAVIIGVLGLVFLYWTTQTKIPEIETETARLETANRSLEQTEQNLAKLYNNMDFYLNETKRLNEETEVVLTEFPTFMYLEDKILYAYNLLNTDLKGYNMSNFSYGPSAYMMNVMYGTNENMLELYKVTLSGRYTDLTYSQVKEVLDYGLGSSQRFVINNLTMLYNDQTGYISGQFSFTTYFIPGQSTPYEFPQEVIDGLGNSDRIDDLFGARKDPVVIDPDKL